MNSTTTCTYGYQTVAGTLDSYPVVSTGSCVTVADATATSSAGRAYDGPNMVEFLAVACVILFFLALRGWRDIFGGLKYLNDN